MRAATRDGVRRPSRPRSGSPRRLGSVPASASASFDGARSATPSSPAPVARSGRVASPSTSTLDRRGTETFAGDSRLDLYGSRRRHRQGGRRSRDESASDSARRASSRSRPTGRSASSRRALLDQAVHRRPVGDHRPRRPSGVRADVEVGRQRRRRLLRRRAVGLGVAVSRRATIGPGRRPRPRRAIAAVSVGAGRSPGLAKCHSSERTSPAGLPRRRYADQGEGPGEGEGGRRRG